MFNSISHIGKKSSILWVILKRGSILHFVFKKKYSTLCLSRVQSVQFLESYFNKVQIFESYFNKVQIFESKSWILRVILKKRVQFFESCWKIQSFVSYHKNSILSLGHIRKSSIIWDIQEKRPIFWVIFWSSFLRIILEEGSILRVMWKNNSWSHMKITLRVKTKEQKFCVILRIQFFESYSRRRVQFFETCWKRV